MLIPDKDTSTDKGHPLANIAIEGLQVIRIWLINTVPTAF